MQYEDLALYRPTPLESAIESWLRKLDMLSPYEIDLDIIAQELNIELRYLPRETNSVRLGDTHFVVVDSRLHWTQQRIEMAHEIGHILMHAGNQLRMPDDLRNLQEWQADRFGMYLLMPTFMVANCLTSAYSRKQMLRQLAEVFDVTDVFVDVRLNILEQRIRSLQWDQQVANVVAEQRQMYDYTYPHPTNKRIEYMVKDGYVIGSRRRAE
ncbi:ImmA/IrrE family metallo-endopeptidase [Alicyclobacillus ferrooxydans]|uniref:ImmA/IrrE family metallo-endopeptidase n=1 Tax=Alicyclobacillus ferrooxydans TaxID=471514 RepID=UPI0006D53981|nr:ImmA/IrrE family metallo-endopeptidase [Alicyclobacillus ferrooxydans]